MAFCGPFVNLTVFFLVWAYCFSRGELSEVYAATEEGQLWLPNLPGKMVNTTGCGDAFMAALVWAYLEGTDLKNTALAGLAAGSIAMESQETINPAMSADEIKKRMNNN